MDSAELDRNSTEEAADEARGGTETQRTASPLRHQDDDTSPQPDATPDSSIRSMQDVDAPPSQCVWYADKDGGFFIEKRQPFQRFNFMCIGASLGFFFYCVYIIISDYRANNANPPTSQLLENRATQLFPGMLVCNHDKRVPIELIAAIHRNDTNRHPGYDISDQVKAVDCDQQQPCLHLDSELPAFRNDRDVGCAGTNVIVLSINVNAQNYSNASTLFVGADGFLHVPGRGEEIAEATCRDLFPRCASFAPSYEECPEELTARSFDHIRASTNAGSFVALTRSETQASPPCNKDVISWNPVVTMMNYNPAVLNDSRIAEASSLDSLVTMQFQFNTPMVVKTSYNPPSGFAMFGSLSGWYGFLTDGWGVISLLFLIERVFMYCHYPYRKTRCGR